MCDESNHLHELDVVVVVGVERDENHESDGRASNRRQSPSGRRAAWSRRFKKRKPPRRFMPEDMLRVGVCSWVFSVSDVKVGVVVVVVVVVIGYMSCAGGVAQ